MTRGQAPKSAPQPAERPAGTRGPADDRRPGGESRRWAPARWPLGRGDRSRLGRGRRLTYWMLAAGVVLAWVGPAVAAIQAVMTSGVSVLRVTAQAAGLTVFTVLYLRAVRSVLAGRFATRTVAAAGAVTLALLTGPHSEYLSWVTLGAAWASLAVLGVSSRTAAVICVATTLVTPIVALKAPPDPATLLFNALLCILLPWSNRFQLWLWELVRDAEQGREAQARLAVTEERLRFARDLHDLVGHSLTAIAVKSEVAEKLARKDMARAAEEMAEVRRLAREALREIRAAVRGYRTVDLDAELRSVRAVLEAGGVRCTLTVEPETGTAGLPQDVSTLLAWVVREGATNVLRHSRAGACEIGLRVRDGRVVLQMRNDGAGPGAPDAPADAAPGGDEERGIGLAGLAERVASAGGVLRAGPAGRGRWELSAEIPLRGAT
ncbi:sensor histidine kinase [Thermopolyspora flexuosa]|uniref:sensor histidine kinase n=1 Tax=Thermopolyspora flexuosa TaxID=103836 RepID=UPI00114D72D4|nr:histidine kinase [Thermopolyspora flexuosa]